MEAGSTSQRTVSETSMHTVKVVVETMIKVAAACSFCSSMAQEDSNHLEAFDQLDDASNSQ